MKKIIYEKYLHFLLRLFLGCMFVFSGVVKIIDPLGTAYKLEEYFSVFGLDFLKSFALWFALILVVTELLIGVALLIGYRSKNTAQIFLGLNILFLFLTGYSAITRTIKDCGCFGDAIKLTAQETFYKNIALTTFAIYWLLMKKHHSKMTQNWQKITMIGLLFLCISLINHTLRHLPLIDFRAFAQGKNISVGINTGKIHDFYIEKNNNGTELTAEILSSEKVLLVVMENLQKTNLEAVKKINATAKKARKKGYKIYLISASSVDECTEFEEKFLLPPIDFCDGTVLKTIIRSSVGYVLLEKGTVIEKVSWRDTDKLSF